MRKYVVIVGGGKGERMKAQIPKQFLLLYDKPLIVHTIEAFKKYDPYLSFVIVLPQLDLEYWKQELFKYIQNKNIEITAGGDERFYSVNNGLACIKEEDAIVAIHDSVRPLVSLKTIDQCFKVADENGSAVPVIEVNESVRMINNGESETIDRYRLRLIQTPQVFHAGKLKEAYNKGYSSRFTDDAGVFECAGNKIYLVEGNRENIKITTPEDMEVAKVFFKFLKKD